MTTVKNAVFIGFQIENCCVMVGGGGWEIKIWWERKQSIRGKFF